MLGSWTDGPSNFPTSQRSNSQIRDHLLDGLPVGLRYLDLRRQLGFPARPLLREDVRMEGVIAQQLAASRFLEPLGGAAVRLHFRHSSTPNLLKGISIPAYLLGAMTIVIRLPCTSGLALSAAPNSLISVSRRSRTARP